MPHIVRKRKKSKIMGTPDIISRQDIEAMQVNARLDLVRSLIHLGLTRKRGEFPKDDSVSKGTVSCNRSGLQEMETPDPGLACCLELLLNRVRGKGAGLNRQMMSRSVHLNPIPIQPQHPQ